jgi:(1->4)-alpha-D-glucan 1-alpha-D-glucosylmutase
VPYLADLGVSHLYTSPILRARSGSTHGYDVVDPTQVAPELGGEAGLRELVAVLRAGTAWAWSSTWSPTTWPPRTRAPGGSETLGAGPDAAAARVFDIDWEAGGGKGPPARVWRPLDEVADQVDVGDGWVSYHEHRFPWPRAPTGSTAALRAGRLAPGRRRPNYRRFFTVNEPHRRPPGGPRGLRT